MIHSWGSSFIDINPWDVYNYSFKKLSRSITTNWFRDIMKKIDRKKINCCGHYFDQHIMITTHSIHEESGRSQTAKFGSLLNSSFQNFQFHVRNFIFNLTIYNLFQHSVNGILSGLVEIILSLTCSSIVSSCLLIRSSSSPSFL